MWTARCAVTRCRLIHICRAWYAHSVGSRIPWYKHFARPANFVRSTSACTGIVGLEGTSTTRIARTVARCGARCKAEALTAACYTVCNALAGAAVIGLECTLLACGARPIVSSVAGRELRAHTAACDGLTDAQAAAL